MPVSPTAIKIFTDNGRQSMAVPFALSGRYVFVWARAHFIRESGSGTDTATLTIDIVSRAGVNHNTRLASISGAGVSADVFLRIHPDEYQDWTFENGDRIQFNWTNPDSDGISWGIEVALAPA